MPKRYLIKKPFSLRYPFQKPTKDKNLSGDLQMMIQIHQKIYIQMLEPSDHIVPCGLCFGYLI